jgi:hypothetical protein
MAKLRNAGPQAGIRVTKSVRDAAPLGVEFVTRQIATFDTHWLAFDAMLVSSRSGAVVHKKSRRPISVDLQLDVGVLPQGISIELPTIGWNSDLQQWRCADPAVTEMLDANPGMQTVLSAASAIAHAGRDELHRALNFIDEQSPIKLSLSNHQTRGGATEWFTRTLTETLDTLDEVVVAHSAWGLFDWLRHTKQVPGRHTKTGTSLFVQQWLGQFRAERALAALQAWV